MLEQIKEQIQEIFTSMVNPAIADHEGSISLVDVEINNSDQIDVLIDYHGGCSGCSMSLTSTLMAIQSLLTDELKGEVIVHVRDKDRGPE